MPTGTATSLGRFHAPDPPSALMRLHFRTAEKLTAVDHEPKIAVLDQEDLPEQGIDVSTFIAGAPRLVKALGSCTCNTLVEALSRILSPQAFAHLISTLGVQTLEHVADLFTDVVAAERCAIGLYHAITDQTGQSSTEWPPTDCGSSGPYLYQWALAHGLIASEEIAHGADNICSVMQADGALTGLPWLQAWFEPNSGGFVDGNGSHATLEEQIKSGVAGGHEIYFSAIEKLVLYATGHVDPFHTVIRFRNHWTRSWADNGSGRFHLSTIVALGNSVDVRRFTAKAAA